MSRFVGYHDRFSIWCLLGLVWLAPSKSNHQKKDSIRDLISFSKHSSGDVQEKPKIYFIWRTAKECVLLLLLLLVGAGCFLYLLLMQVRERVIVSYNIALKEGDSAERVFASVAPQLVLDGRRVQICRKSVRSWSCSHRSSSNRHHHHHRHHRHLKANVQLFRVYMCGVFFFVGQFPRRECVISCIYVVSDFYTKREIY